MRYLMDKTNEEIDEERKQRWMREADEEADRKWEQRQIEQCEKDMEKYLSE